MEKQKLRNSREFRKVYDTGKSYANKYLVMFFLNNDKNTNIVGFATTKKLGNSVVRNKVRRRMKEAYRLNSNKIKEGYDIVFLSRVKAKEVTFKEIESALLHLAKISGLLKKGE